MLQISKFPHQEIRWNCGVFCCKTYIFTNLFLKRYANFCEHARGVFSTVSNINCQTISKNCWHQKAVKCFRKTFGFVLLHHCCYSAVAVDAIPKEIVRAISSFILAVCGVSVHVWTVSHENGPRRNGCKSVYPFGVPVSWRRNTAYKLVFRYFV